MRSEEFSAKTIEEALKLGLDSFGLGADDVEYEILEQPSKGFLGFGGKSARIKITEKTCLITVLLLRMSLTLIKNKY